MINTPDWKLKKKKEVERGRDEAFDKRMADSGVNDIWVLKMQIRGLGLKFCMPVLFSKPPILLSQAHQFCIFRETVKQEKYSTSSHVYEKT